MQAGQKHGMQTMNQALFNAVVSKEIDTEEAMRRSLDQAELSGCSGSRSERGVKRVERRGLERGHKRWRRHLYGRAAARTESCSPVSTTRRARRTGQPSPQAQDHHHVDAREGQGRLGPQDAGPEPRQRQRHGCVHAPVRDHDQRRSADGAVPRHSVAADGEGILPHVDRARHGGRRRRLDTGRVDGAPPEGVQHAVRQHGGSGRGGRYPGRHPGASGHVPGKSSTRCSARSRVRSRTRRVVAFVAIGATCFMLIFIIPTFAKMFTDFGGKLPLPDVDRHGHQRFPARLSGGF